MIEIIDQKTAIASLSAADRKVAISTAARSALRALPGIYESDASDPSEALLPMIRASLIAVVAGSMQLENAAEQAEASVVFSVPTAEKASNAAHSAIRSASAAVSSVSRSATVSAANAIARSADCAARSAYRLAHSSEIAAREAALRADAVSYRVSSQDIQLLLDSEVTSDVFLQPLWLDEDVPTGLEHRLKELREFWGNTPKVWRYWDQWYGGFLSGNPVAWDVQQAIAMLPNEDWVKGPERIAEQIDKIEARIALEKRLQELQGLLISESKNRNGIGGNYPPAPIETIAEVPRELVVVWEPLTALQQQAHSDEPDISAIKRAINKLAAIAVGCGAWTWAKANVFLDTALKTGGAAAGTAAIAFTTGHGDKIIAVIKAALDWLAFL